jgi:hypothetical protein
LADEKQDPYQQLYNSGMRGREKRADRFKPADEEARPKGKQAAGKDGKDAKGKDGKQAIVHNQVVDDGDYVKVPKKLFEKVFPQQSAAKK